MHNSGKKGLRAFIRVIEKVTLCVLSVGFILTTTTGAASAHVKWFAPYNIAKDPVPYAVFASPQFVLALIASLGFFFAMSMVDQRFALGNRLVTFCRSVSLKPLNIGWQHSLVRSTMLFFFACIFTYGNVILTPELDHSSLYVLSIQGIAVIALFSRLTTPMAGICIVLLWYYGMQKFGLFHLLDYMIFFGIAVYLVLGALKYRLVQKAALAFLYLSVAVTLMWAGIEKFAYPAWSYGLLEEKPELTMGMSKEVFMMVAGFVEFTLAFMLITTTGFGYAFATVGLGTIFILATFLFGKLDIIGQAPIIGVLVLMAIQGPSLANFGALASGGNTAAKSVMLTGLYLVSFLGVFHSYYQMRDYEFRNESEPVKEPEPEIAEPRLLVPEPQPDDHDHSTHSHELLLEPTESEQELLLN